LEEEQEVCEEGVWVLVRECGSQRVWKCENARM